MARKGVGGLQYSAPLEPSPAGSKQLSADRKSLELSFYGVKLLQGIVVATHSFTDSPYAGSCSLCCICCRPQRGRSRIVFLIVAAREVIENSAPTPAMVVGCTGKLFTHT